jgi:hypothetical protein
LFEFGNWSFGEYHEGRDRMARALTDVWAPELWATVYKTDESRIAVALQTDITPSQILRSAGQLLGDGRTAQRSLLIRIDRRGL